MSRSIYVPSDDAWATLCCGVRLSGDIVVGETVCPYCNEPISALDEDDVDEDDWDASCDVIEAECSRCGTRCKCIYSDDPYMRELHPEEPNESGYWCYRCYDQRSGDI